MLGRAGSHCTRKRAEGAVLEGDLFLGAGGYGHVQGRVGLDA